MSDSVTKKKRGRTLDRSNRIYALFLVFLGIVFIAIPHNISGMIIYFIFVMLLGGAVSSIVNAVMANTNFKRLLHIINCAISITLGVLLFALKSYDKELIAIIMIIHTVLQIFACFYEVIKYRKEKSKVIVAILNIVIYIILIVELILSFKGNIDTHIITYGTLFIVQGLVGIISSLNLTNDKNSFAKVIIKSHTLEITAGLLVVIVGASLILPACEPGIATFGDALWYCFMLVTTIGLGDFTAQTNAGRLISVIVGLYGIVVFALVTSILVNIYNEKKFLNVKK